jgi:hypothetical protein
MLKLDCKQKQLRKNDIKKAKQSITTLNIAGKAYYHNTRN